MKSSMIAVAAAAIASATQVRYEAPTLCCGWKVLPTNAISEQESGASVSFTFAVRQSNVDKVHSLVEQVSDPTSPHYGNYLSSDEINQLTTPAKEDVKAVASWLKENGVNFDIANKGRDIKVTTSVQKASALLNTEFRTLVNQEANQQLVRASAFSMPKEIDDVVGAVYGLQGMPLPKNREATAADTPAIVTPTVLAATYGVSGVKASGNTNNRMAVAEFMGQNEKDSDLAQFFQSYVPTALPGDEKVYKFIGDPDKEEAGVEASLDIQYMMGVAPHLKAEFWLFDGQDFCKDLKNWTDTIISDAGAPLVHSVSYGWQGDVHQIGCTDAALDDIDANFAKLALKGISILFSSGDSGSQCTSESCYASWPASSPFVTAVGATRFVGQQIGAEQMVVDQFGSGGGFSKRFTTSSNYKWQAEAVKEYLGNVTASPTAKFPPANLFNSAARATPDLSLLGEGYQVIVNGQVQSIGGTSASCPAFGGMVSLINEARLAKKMPPMGLLNPFLYQNKYAFTDIVKGTNAIGRGAQDLIYGFEAIQGWDAATGLGVPKFDALLTAALKPKALGKKFIEAEPVQSAMF